MKTVMTLVVRDEEDIIGQNITFHLNHGVDFVIVTDNHSVDGTREILEKYRRLGVLHYIHEAADDFAQATWVTRMARLAVQQFAADWVINSDADEFWWAERAQDVKAVFRRVPAAVSGLRVHRHNFVPRPDTGDRGFLETMIYRQAVSTNALGEPLPPKVCHRALSEFSVAQGNHAVFVGSAELNVPTTNELCILHFPLRTLKQFSHKIEKGGAAYARSDLPRGVGSTWRKLFKLHQRGHLDLYFGKQLFDDRRVRRALAAGELKEDRRLLRFFEEAGLDTRAHLSPDRRASTC